MNRVILLIESSFNKRDYDRFGIGILSSNGFTVEVWDLSSVLHHGVEIECQDYIETPEVRKYNSQKEVKEAFNNLTNKDIVVIWLIYNYKHLWIYIAISRKSVYCVMQLNALPIRQKESSNNSHNDKIRYIKLIINMITKLFKIVISFKYEPLLDYLVKRIPYNLLGINPSVIWFAGGEESLRNYFFPHNTKTKIIWAHAFDYDIYLKTSKKGTILNKAVFLDSYLPFHSDYQLFNLKPCVTANNYYNMLNILFDLIESELRLNVIIAAHPRSSYENKHDYFYGRKRYKGNTIDMVRDSKLVISHASTAINYAVLYSKPIIIVYTEEMAKDPYMSTDCRCMASWLGKKPVLIKKDMHVDWEKELDVNSAYYNEYINKYIKKDGSIEKQCWQIVSDELRKIVTV